jgi:hypothetical protein
MGNYAYWGIRPKLIGFMLDVKAIGLVRLRPLNSVELQTKFRVLGKFCFEPAGVFEDQCRGSNPKREGLTRLNRLHPSYDVVQIDEEGPAPLRVRFEGECVHRAVVPFHAFEVRVVPHRLLEFRGFAHALKF